MDEIQPDTRTVRRKSDTEQTTPKKKEIKWDEH